MKEASFTRVKRPTIAARDFYNRISGFYDQFAASSERRHTIAGVHMLAAQPGQSVLEIGFGTGQALVALARAVGDLGHIVGLDVSEGMYRVARRRIQQAGLADSVELILGDAANLPCRQTYFDAVFISFTLELFDTPQIPEVLSECRRVLKSHGHLCVVSLSRDNKLGLVGQIYEQLHNRFPTYLDCRPIPIASILSREGFRVLDGEQHSMWGLPVSIALAKIET